MGAFTETFLTYIHIYTKMAIFAASSINSVAVIWGYSAGGTVSNMDD
ncbi:unnamed protein product, partial [Cylindrotheca closterium]